MGVSLLAKVAAVNRVRMELGAIQDSATHFISRLLRDGDALAGPRELDRREKLRREAAARPRGSPLHGCAIDAAARP
jgi:hypothetical protein